MPAALLAIIGKIVEVLARVLLIPALKEWKKKRAEKKEQKRIEQRNRELGENYENANPDDADDEFGRLP